MKKWILVIFPSAMLALFLVAYFAESKKRHAREEASAAVVAQEKKAKDEKDAAMRAKAAKEADKRAADRAASDKKKEEDRLAKWNKDGKEIQDETDRAAGAADKASKEITQMEAQLAKLRDARDRANREFLELLKKSQMAEIERRTAELEIKRLLAMIETRAGDSAAASARRAMPAPPPAKRSE